MNQIGANLTFTDLDSAFVNSTQSSINNFSELPKDVLNKLFGYLSLLGEQWNAPALLYAGLKTS